ncbi:MAG: hypothetical protein ACSLFC_01820 [Desulfuromonadales bacterium]
MQSTLQTAVIAGEIETSLLYREHCDADFPVMLQDYLQCGFADCADRKPFRQKGPVN